MLKILLLYKTLLFKIPWLFFWLTPTIRAEEKQCGWILLKALFLGGRGGGGDIVKIDSSTCFYCKVFFKWLTSRKLVMK